MPHYTRPEHIRDYFDQYQISISTSPSTVKKGIESAEALGFRHTTNDVGDVIVTTPLQHRKVYRGFGKARYQLCAVLMHAMFSSVMH